jgi:hypothetical protein
LGRFGRLEIAPIALKNPSARVIQQAVNRGKSWPTWLDSDEYLVMTTSARLLTTTLALFACFAAGCGGQAVEESGQAAAVVPVEPKANSVPKLLAAVPEEATSIALSGTRVFFTAKRSQLGGVMTDNGSIYSIWKSGGEADLLAFDKYGAAWTNLVVVDRQLIWNTSDGRLLAMAEQGGAVRMIADKLGPIGGFVADGAAAYVAAAPTGSPAGLYRVDLRTGAKRLLAEQNATSALAQSGDSVYVASKLAGVIAVVDKASGAMQTVASGQTSICGLSVVGGDLIWTTSGDLTTKTGGSVRRSRAGSIDVIAAQQLAPCALATDGESLFWAPAQNAPADAKLMRASLRGDAVTAMGAMTVLQDLGSVAVDERHVFWITREGVYHARK